MVKLISAVTIIDKANSKWQQITRLDEAAPEI
jgi:hypothetical protein